MTFDLVKLFKINVAIIGLLFMVNLSLAQSYDSLPHWEIELEGPFVAHTHHKLIIHYDSNEGYFIWKQNQMCFINEKEYSVEWNKTHGEVEFEVNEKELQIDYLNATLYKSINPIPLWVSILPPLIAILLALVFREVITSLFIGILSGSLVIAFYGEGVSGLFRGFLRVIDHYVIDALNDWSHLAVIVFSMTIGAVVSIVSKNGGMRGVVNRLAPYAHNPKSGQLVIWVMGLLIFFDDYANTLVVGNTMRPVADRLRISREKLAYLVDSTAAPVASIAFITTWIGAELGYIQSGIADLHYITESPYSIFLNSLAYSYYPIFTLIFMVLLISNKRDYGPMYKAEQKARKLGVIGTKKSGKLEKLSDDFVMEPGLQPKAYNAIIPILVIIFGVMAGMYYTGFHATEWSIENLKLSFFRRLSLIIGNADSFSALLWASISGAVIAIILTLYQKLLSLEDTIKSGINGFRSILPAMIILTLAWGLATLTKELHTADFLYSLWSDSFSPLFIPAVVFILSALVSFSTGSSWGTMAILYPLLLPASYYIAIDAGLPHDQVMAIFYNVVAVILAGSVFGDHCSPISDTTILSSLASSCNHIDHVRTQLPYAITTGLISILVGTIPAAIGAPFWLLLILGTGMMYVTVRYVGKKTD